MDSEIDVAGFKVTAALADLVVSAMLTAVTVMVCGAVMPGGAV